jgi:hypothetical protein
LHGRLFFAPLDPHNVRTVLDIGTYVLLKTHAGLTSISLYLALSRYISWRLTTK